MNHSQRKTEAITSNIRLGSAKERSKKLTLARIDRVAEGFKLAFDYITSDALVMTPRKEYPGNDPLSNLGCSASDQPCCIDNTDAIT